MAKPKIFTDLENRVPKSRTVNEKALTDDISLNNSDVGAAPTSHTHDTSDINAGTLPVARGGTGVSNLETLRMNMGIPDSLNMNTITKYTLLAADTPIILEEITELTNNPIPTTGWISQVVLVNYVNQEYNIYTPNSTQSGYEVYKLLDGDINTSWRSTSTTVHEVVIRFPVLLKVSKVSLMFSTSSSGFTNYVIRGSNNASSWTNLYVGSSIPSSSTQVTMSSPNYYQYYSILFTRSTADSIVFSDFRLTEYAIRAHTMPFTVSEYPTSWVVGQRVLVQTPTTEPPEIILNNTLNNIVINTILKYNKRYELIYNSDTFDAKEV